MLEYFDLTQSILHIGQRDALALAKAHGTPLYVYDAAIFEAKYKKLRQALPAQVDIFFAIKSNPSLAVVNLFRSLGAGVDLASLGELYTALKAGVTPQKIVFTGPSKTEGEIEAAIKSNIFAINAESERELERIDRIARAYGKKFPIGLRLNVGFAPKERTTVIGGTAPQKFGIDVVRALEALKLAKGLRNVELIGIHIFNASQVLDAKAMINNAENIFATAFELSQKANVDLKYIDMGGGLGIPYTEEERELDVTLFGKGLAEILARYTAKGLPKNLRVLLEPGRYLTAEAGVYLTRVIDIKESRGQHFVLVDGGVHHLLRPTWFPTGHPVRVVNKFNQEARMTYSIGGPLCTALDYLAKNVMLPPLEVGDLLAVFDVGAYGFTESMPYFLSHATPAEVMMLSSKDYLIRPRLTPEEYLQSQSVPDPLKLSL
jgi:diaminopimelate decarboxylase